MSKLNFIFFTNLSILHYGNQNEQTKTACNKTVFPTKNQRDIHYHIQLSACPLFLSKLNKLLGDNDLQ